MEQKTYRRGRFHQTSVMNEDFGNEYSQDYDTRIRLKKAISRAHKILTTRSSTRITKNFSVTLKDG